MKQSVIRAHLVSREHFITTDDGDFRVIHVVDVNDHTSEYNQLMVEMDFTISPDGRTPIVETATMRCNPPKTTTYKGVAEAFEKAYDSIRQGMQAAKEKIEAQHSRARSSAENKTGKSLDPSIGEVNHHIDNERRIVRP